MYESKASAGMPEIFQGNIFVPWQHSLGKWFSKILQIMDNFGKICPTTMQSKCGCVWNSDWCLGFAPSGTCLSAKHAFSKHQLHLSLKPRSCFHQFLYIMLNVVDGRYSMLLWCCAHVTKTIHFLCQCHLFWQRSWAKKLSVDHDACFHYLLWHVHIRQHCTMLGDTKLKTVN